MCVRVCVCVYVCVFEETNLAPPNIRSYIEKWLTIEFIFNSSVLRMRHRTRGLPTADRVRTGSHCDQLHHDHVRRLQSMLGMFVFLLAVCSYVNSTNKDGKPFV